MTELFWIIVGVGILIFLSLAGVGVLAIGLGYFQRENP